MAAETYINDAGVARRITRIYINDAGVARDITEVWVNDNGTARKIFAKVLFTNIQTLFNSVWSEYTAVTFKADGGTEYSSSFLGSPSDNNPGADWLSPTSAATNYDIRVQQTAGAGGAVNITGGSLNTWYPITSNRQVVFTASATALFEYRLTGVGSAIYSESVSF